MSIRNIYIPLFNNLIYFFLNLFISFKENSLKTSIERTQV